MYRVELKAFLYKILKAFGRVFLMYRVELKDVDETKLEVDKNNLFLMYRVELKGEFGRLRPGSGHSS